MLTDELRHYLRTVVIQQRGKVERVARLRLMNPRTLSRRLRAEGTTFRRLHDEVQFGMAKQLLADTRMTLAQISNCLGFSEPAAFTHAFRRWSGTTPSAWRQANRSQTGRNGHHEDPHPCAQKPPRARCRWAVSNRGRPRV